MLKLAMMCQSSNNLIVLLYRAKEQSLQVLWVSVYEGTIVAFELTIASLVSWSWAP